MRTQKLLVPILLGMALISQACTPRSTIKSNDATLQAAVTQTLDAENTARTATEAAQPTFALPPTWTLVPSATPRPVTLTPMPPTQTVTPFEPPIPLVSVSISTNCRSGPGTEFELLGNLNAGDVAKLVGKYPSLNYWLIKNPDKAGNCWLWGEYATVIGSTALVPLVTPPPTPAVPILLVSADTTCYSSPDSTSSPLGTINVGERPAILGRDPYSNSYLVKNPDAAGNCWVSGQYATVQGSIPLIPTAATPAASNNSDYRCAFVKRGPSDGSNFDPGASFDAFWTIKNTGDKTWKGDVFRYGYSSGTKMFEGKDTYVLPKDIAPDKEFTITLDMVAPQNRGTYSMIWNLYYGEIQICSMPVLIQVK